MRRLMSSLVVGLVISGLAVADTSENSSNEQANFKAKLDKMAGPLGPFAKSDDFPKSYFLIPHNLPYMVGLTLFHPMSKTLSLNQEQTNKIKTIKENTVPMVAKAAKEIKTLELELAQGVLNNESTDTLLPLVDKISALRTDLTKKHLHCIKQVRNILTEDQYKKLLAYASNA